MRKKLGTASKIKQTIKETFLKLFNDLSKGMLSYKLKILFELYILFK